MISFIIIGRNEEQHLTRCIESIYSSVRFNNIREYEIIYIDSKSTDRSISIVKQFETINIFKVEGYCNAAIGRNIGAAEAKGDILYFIDADMAMSEMFLSAVLDAKKRLKYNIVSGVVVDVENGVETRSRFDVKGSALQKEVLNGGIFLIKKDLWIEAGGMRTKFDNGEEGDLGLRLSKKGVYLIRINQIIAHHHTVPYLDTTRIWKMLMNKSMFYCRCVLYRDHITNKYLYRKVWTDDKTFILLIGTAIAVILNPTNTFYFIFSYFSGVVVRSLRQKDAFKMIIYHILSDNLNLIYFFSFFPKNKPLLYSAA